MTNKWQDGSGDGSESEIKVSDIFGSYFNDENDTETVDSVVSDDHWERIEDMLPLATCWLTVMLEMNQSQKIQKKNVT